MCSASWEVAGCKGRFVKCCRDRFRLRALGSGHRQAIDGDINTSDEGKAVNIFADTVLMEKGINGNGKNGKR